MAKSIKLGSDTYLDSSGVAVNAYGNTLSDCFDISTTNTQAAVSVSNGSWATVDSFELPPHSTILVKEVVAFAQNDTGSRRVGVSASQDTAVSSPIDFTTVMAALTAPTVVNVFWLLNNPGASALTRYVNVYQNSGSTITATPRRQIVRLK